jgi:membrane protease YdiL (CAAX protease family)
MSVTQSPERHPFTSLLQLLLFVLGGSVLFTCLSLVLGYAIYGEAGMSMFRETVNGGGNEGLGFLKIVQIVSTIGTFIIPAIIFAWVQNGNISSYLNLDKKVPLYLLVISFAVMFTVVPLLEWTVNLNKAMHLPGFLKEIELWMRAKEDQLSRLTMELLIMKGIPDLAVNLLMIAVLPALGEEFVFRGCLQKIFAKWTGNYHAGIWIAAILFSAIHLQFYGFIPRMLLGALFGYLYVWGGSLWLPVLAHFVNNATTVIIAYQYQLQGKPLDGLDEASPMNWTSYLFSAAITAVLLGVFYNYYQKRKILKEDTEL